MKKITFFFLIVAATINVVTAQDTVRYPDRWYGYTPREALMEYTGPAQTNMPGILVEHWYTAFNDQHESYIDCDNYLPTETPPEYRLFLLRPVDSGANKKMYGIAVTMEPEVFDTISGKLIVYRGVSMAAHPSDVFPGAMAPHSYDGNVDSIIAIPFNDPPLMKECVFEYDYSLPEVWSLYSNCYEFYFDEPLDLSQPGTYIGITDCGFYQNKLNLGRDTSRSQELYRVSYGTTNSEAQIRFTNWLMNGIQYTGPGKYLDYYEVPGYEDFYWYDCYWGMIFPILSPRCTAPKDFRIVHSEERLDTVLWRGDPESDVFQVSVASYPASPDSGSIFTVTDTTFVLPMHPADTVQVAYVRKMCTFEFDTHTDTVWGDWAGPVLVAGDTTGLGGGDTTGIATADLQQVSITPNPATGTVTVRSAERMTTLEVFDAAGAPVLRQGAEGHAATLNTAAWPKGTYMVRITTANGVTTRKLVVQ